MVFLSYESVALLPSPHYPRIPLINFPVFICLFVVVLPVAFPFFFLSHPLSLSLEERESAVLWRCKGVFPYGESLNTVNFAAFSFVSSSGSS